tara:strand:- start:622 stop:951 length:330 start_codon:yes stop_codon:yes gene_type:complete
MTLTQSNIIYCTRENQINKLIKDQKFSKKKSYFLFISLWDDVCSSLVKELESNPPPFPINVINSFDTPHSFVIWGVKKAPTLVMLDGGGRKVSTTCHVTDIYKRLKLEK